MVLAALALSPAVRAATDTITYTITPDFIRGVTHVDVSWQTGDRSHSIIGVSSRWGRINDVTALLRDMTWQGATTQRDGVRWILSHRPGATIGVRYTVDPRHRAFDDWDYTHHPITTDSFFHGMGNAFLLTPEPITGMSERIEAVVRWKLPAGVDAVCSWGAGRTVGASIDPSDLRHSVYLAGKLKKKTIHDDGRTITVAIVDDFDFTVDQFAKLTASIVKGQCDFMVEKDFPEFVVTAIPVGKPVKPGESRLAGSGLYQSFALFAAPRSRLNDAIEHLFAHELFHHWNGRLLPAHDPERMVYWFVEGITDYYALRILFESGVWDAATYAKWINRHLREYADNPAINASNADINRDYWTKRDTVGEVAYQRGLTLGLRWNKMAHGKGVTGGFDALFHTLVDRGRSSGFELTNEAIRDAGGRILGSWFFGEFDRYVTGAATVDVPPDALEPALKGDLEDVYEYALGFDHDRTMKDRRVTGLDPDSPAAKAGLREGDELAGWKLSGNAEQETTLYVQRGNQRKTIRFYARGAKHQVMQFTPRRKAKNGSP